MLKKFSKTGVAAAVAAAVGGMSGAAQAVTVGEPGTALLVPYVLFNSCTSSSKAPCGNSDLGAVNTLIGVIVANNVRNTLNDTAAELLIFGTFANFPTLTSTSSATNFNGFNGEGCTSTASRLHYYFFNAGSVHLADNSIEVTCEDFVRLDWGNQVKTIFKSLDGVPGYIVIADENGRTRATALARGSDLALFGATYLIQGNWASEAFIPTLPLRDDADRLTGGGLNPLDEVTYGTDRVPAQVTPNLSGMRLPGFRGQSVQFSMRYFLDPALGGETAFVLWFPDNRSTRGSVAVDVYDADEANISTRVSVPNELNVIDVSTLDGTINDPAGPPPLPSHEIPDWGIGDPIDQGFVLFQIDDSVGTSAAPETRAGVAFSLVGITGGTNPIQVQTEMAHERGLTP